MKTPTTTQAITANGYGVRVTHYKTIKGLYQFMAQYMVDYKVDMATIMHYPTEDILQSKPISKQTVVTAQDGIIAFGAVPS